MSNDAVEPDCMTVLRMADVTRSYGARDHRRQVVRGLSLTVERGRIVCLLGPNGAGKTTTVKMASTLLLPDSGEISVCGVDAIRDQFRARRYLSLLFGGERGFYARATAIDNLRFFARVAGVPGRLIETRAHEALERVNLLDKANERVETFSRGMCQRLHIARTLCSKSRLVLLDEPTTGLDPQSALEVRDLIAGLRDEGAGILLTTHSMPEAEVLADSVNVIREGRIIAVGTVHELSERLHIDGVGMYMDFDIGDGDHDEGMRRLAALPGVRGVDASPHGGVWSFNLICQGGEPDLERVREAAGLPSLRRLGWRPATLEELYLALLRTDDNGHVDHVDHGKHGGELTGGNADEPAEGEAA